MRTRTDREILDRLYELRRELADDQEPYKRHFTTLINAIKEQATLDDSARRTLVLTALTRWQTLTLDELVEETELSVEVVGQILSELVSQRRVTSSRRYSPFLKNPNDRQQIFTLSDED